MLLGILKAIAAIPSIISMLRDLGKWMEDVKFDQWMDDSRETFRKLREAESAEEKLEAAKDIQSLIRRL